MNPRGDDLPERAIAAASGSTHAELAELLGVSRESVTKYASGERTMPARVRVRLAKLLRKQSAALDTLAADLEQSASDDQ